MAEAGEQGGEESDEDVIPGGRTRKQRQADLARQQRSAEVEKILQYDPHAENGQGAFLVKFQGLSYRKAGWIPRNKLMEMRAQLTRNYLAKGVPIHPEEEEWLQPERIIARRQLPPNRRPKGVSESSVHAFEYLVKWRGLEYGDCTWERADDLRADEMELITRYDRFNTPPEPREPVKFDAKTYQIPAFKNGRALRDYQETAVRWMVSNYMAGRNCMLGDEMGLGKTAQCIAVLESLRLVGGVQLPFLLVAPLTTLGHWQREIETWTDMNVVLYVGNANDRSVCQKHEFYYPSHSLGNSRAARRAHPLKFDALLISYETLLKEQNMLCNISFAAGVFDEAHKLKGASSSTRAAAQALDLQWKLLLTGTPIQNHLGELWGILNVLDPQKYPSMEQFLDMFSGRSAALAEAANASFTGDKDMKPGSDAAGGESGNAEGQQQQQQQQLATSSSAANAAAIQHAPPSMDQITKLREHLAPILLRRMKEDVETLPEKEEVVVWVQLTPEQHQYYKALYAKQIGTLLTGVKNANLPGLKNLAMELRKLCCHPFLCEGLEEDINMRRAMAISQAREAGAEQQASQLQLSELEMLVRSCGKMVLLSKLLPRLREEGRRVLIFSQFTRMLDVLQDYMRMANWPVERIDGSVKSRDRQAAIDRFTNGTPQDSFVFLLSTRAGGQGITLTAADTAIIYDSDWNPQNDLQAMARCHRIGQQKEVTVYRLVTRDTYEEHLFQTASRKYGLDEAVLGFGPGNDTAGDPENDAKRVAALLEHGAHGLLSANAQEGVEQASAAFQNADIDTIMKGRTDKRQMGSRAGNSFSVARFAVAEEDALVPQQKQSQQPQKGEGPKGKELWKTLLPEEAAKHEAKVEAEKRGPVMEGPRQRRPVNYAQQEDDSARKPKKPSKRKSGGEESDYSGKSKESSEAEWELAEGEDDGRGRKRGRPVGSAMDAAGSRKWSVREGHMLMDGVLAFGGQRWQDLQRHFGSLSSRPTRDVAEAGEALTKVIEVAPAVVESSIRMLSSSTPPLPPAKDGASSEPSLSAVAMYHAANAVYQQVCSLGPLDALSAKEKKEREEQAREVGMKSAIIEMKVLPDTLAEYAVRSDTLKKLTKDAQLNKQKIQHSREIVERVRQAEAQEKEQQPQQEGVKQEAGTPQAGAGAAPKPEPMEEDEQKPSVSGAAKGGQDSAVKQEQPGTSGKEQQQQQQQQQQQPEQEKRRRRPSSSRQATPEVQAGSVGGGGGGSPGKAASVLARAVQEEARSSQVCAMQGYRASAAQGSVQAMPGGAGSSSCAGGHAVSLSTRPVRKEKALPAWWNHYCDEALFRSAAARGVHPPKDTVDFALREPAYGLSGIVQPGQEGEKGEQGAVARGAAAAELGDVGKNLVNKARKEEAAVMLRTGHRVLTNVYGSKGGDIPLPDGLLYYRQNIHPSGSVLLHQPRMPGPPPAINASSSGNAQAGTPAGPTLPPLHVPAPDVEAVVDICQLLPPPESQRPIGQEVLLKFKGYCTDLHAWFPIENVRAILDVRTNFQNEYYKTQSRLRSVLEAERRAAGYNVPTPGGGPAPPPPYPISRKPLPGFSLDRAPMPAQWPYTVSPSHWNAMVSLLVKRLGTVVRVTLEGDQHQPRDKDCVPLPAPPGVRPTPTPHTQRQLHLSPPKRSASAAHTGSEQQQLSPTGKGAPPSGTPAAAGDAHAQQQQCGSDSPSHKRARPSSDGAGGEEEEEDDEPVEEVQPGDSGHAAKRARTSSAAAQPSAFTPTTTVPPATAKRRPLDVPPAAPVLPPPGGSGSATQPHHGKSQRKIESFFSPPAPSSTNNSSATQQQGKQEDSNEPICIE